MSISKTTLNYAEKRNLDVTVEILTDKKESIWIWKEENEMEPIVIYYMNNNGFTFHSSILPNDIKEELPHWIKNEKHLREVLNFISKELKRNIRKNGGQMLPFS